MADAEAQLYRRIKELRARARGAEPAPSPALAATPEDARQCPTCARSWPAPRTTWTSCGQPPPSLEQSLPARVERAVERALDTPRQPRRSAELRDLLLELTGRVDQVNQDLLAERLGRVEDLELVVELLSAGIAADAPGRRRRRARTWRRSPVAWRA